jgi:hypothetical protein
MFMFRVVVAVLCLAAVGPAAAPPFGTVVRQWDLQLSGSYVGAGITWRGDSGRLYLVDQGLPPAIRSCRPEDPTGTLRDERWQLPDLGQVGTPDVPQGVAWDSDSGCFWVSTFVDGSSSNCVLLRMSEAGLWTGDSWTVTGGEFVCLYGIDKSPDLGAFYGGAQWSTESGLASFDPYTRRILGRVLKTSTYGCGCVPADSNYLISTRSSRFLKLSAAGAVLDSVPWAVYSPYDMTVMIPDIVGPEDTAFFFALHENATNSLLKLSTGMNWSQLLAGNRRNVRPTVIVSPPGVVDSGQSITPRLVIRNVGNEPADLVTVKFRIDLWGAQMYLDSVRVQNMPPHSYDTVSFAPWVAQARDSLGGTGWVFWAGDSVHRDDTVRCRFLVRARDVAIQRIITPLDTLDSGEVVVPQVRAANYGNVSETFTVRFRIKLWSCTTRASIVPGGARMVDASQPYPTVPGAYIMVAEALLPGDLHPQNNVCRGAFWVPGAIRYDVAADSIDLPARPDTLATLSPAATLHNYGDSTASFWAFFKIRDSAGQDVYDESLSVLLPGGGRLVLAFPDTRLTEPGFYTAMCSTWYDPDQNMLNDADYLQFEVRTGIAERPAARQDVRLSVAPNPTNRNRVTCRLTVPQAGTATLAVFDVSGRMVLTRALSAGPDESRLSLDLRGLSAGVYLLTLEAHGLQATRKLVIR